MIVVIILIGLVLRLVNLSQSLWLDEAIVVSLLKNFSLWTIVSQNSWHDLHPPGFYILMWFWTNLIGYTEIAMRLPSVVFGVAVIWLVYKICMRLFTRQIALAAAWLVTINPLLIYYSQEARTYSLATFAVLMSFYFFIKFIDTKKINAGLVISIILIIFSTYLAYLGIVAQFLILIIWHRNLIKKMLVVLLPGVVLFLLWSPFFIKQVQTGIETANNLPIWRSVVGSFELKELALIPIKFVIGRISLDNNALYALLAGLIYLIFGWLMFLGLKKKNKNSLMLLIMVGVPILIAFVVSIKFPVFSYFRLLFTLPFLIILLTCGIYQSLRLRIFWIVVVSIFFLVSLFCYYLLPQFQREDWKSLTKWLVQNQDESSIVVLETNGSFAPYDYYIDNQVKTLAGLNKIPANSSDDVNGFEEYSKVFLVEYLIDITDPNKLILSRLQNDGWDEVEVRDFEGVGFVRVWQK